jgi:hypothetical protein
VVDDRREIAIELVLLRQVDCLLPHRNRGFGKQDVPFVGRKEERIYLLDDRYSTLFEDKTAGIDELATSLNPAVCNR